jgi:hypothetical protein
MALRWEAASVSCHDAATVLTYNGSAVIGDYPIQDREVTFNSARQNCGSIRSRRQAGNDRFLAILDREWAWWLRTR